MRQYLETMSFPQRDIFIYLVNTSIFIRVQTIQKKPIGFLKKEKEKEKNLPFLYWLFMISTDSIA